MLEQATTGKSKCRKCEKSRHWATVCRSSKVRSIQTSDLNQELDLEQPELKFNSLNTSHLDQSQCANNFSGSITLNHVDTEEWLASIFVSEINKNFEFLIDSGADITCVPKEIFDVSFLNQLQVSDKIVTGPSGVKLKVLGTSPVKLSFQTHHFDTDIYVIEKLIKPILGRAAIVKLNVLQYINQICPVHKQDLVDTLEDNVMRKFPRNFKDFGTFKTEMHIKLVEGAQPFVQSVPRVVPLLKPLEEELERLQKILSGIKGVVSHIDDILIHAPSIEQHNHILEEVLKRIEAEGITLNKEKCTFATRSITFPGNRISSKGITVDPERILAIQNFPEPKNKKEIGSGSRATDRPIKKNVNFTWDIFLQQSSEKVKKLLQNSPTLAYFDSSKQVSISADSSSYGLGACLIQTSEGKNEIVAYASRLLSDTEKRYAQIEREALALAWAADEFSEYITGILLQTDHRPLIQVLPIDELTPRLQRFRIRLMRYDYKIYYSPGKDLVVADALSRNFSADQAKPSENEPASEVEAHVRLVVQSLQVKPLFLEEIKVEQAKDAILSKIKDFSHTGWPNKNNLCSDLLKFYPYRNEISFTEGFLLRNLRIMIPPSLQLKCLNFIHQGHLGVVKCRERAKLSVWWIGLSTQIENLVRNCPQCVENSTNSKEPFFEDAFSNRP
ncbi:hypothetical protein JTB14_015046 [Gonioctena quinquepunctata]|nr:hypothetical protein JTB14_015046 [Gonioctena quinquepunctata]